MGGFWSVAEVEDDLPSDAATLGFKRDAGPRLTSPPDPPDCHAIPITTPTRPYECMRVSASADVIACPRTPPVRPTGLVGTPFHREYVDAAGTGRPVFVIFTCAVCRLDLVVKGELVNAGPGSVPLLIAGDTASVGGERHLVESTCGVAWPCFPWVISDDYGDGLLVVVSMRHLAGVGAGLHAACASAYLLAPVLVIAEEIGVGRAAIEDCVSMAEGHVRRNPLFLQLKAGFPLAASRAATLADAAAVQGVSGSTEAESMSERPEPREACPVVEVALVLACAAEAVGTGTTVA